MNRTPSLLLSLALLIGLSPLAYPGTPPSFTENPWKLAGQPAGLDEIDALQVFDDHLYAGASNGSAYRYQGDTSWAYAGYTGSGINVMEVFNGDLYAGTMSGHVWRYNGGTSWSSVGNPGLGDYVFSMAVHDGRLYVGTWGGQVFRFNGAAMDPPWTHVGFPPDGHWVNALEAHDGDLYAGRIDGIVYRYDGPFSWADVSEELAVTDVGDLISYDGRLFAADFWEGLVCRFNGMTVDPPWSLVGDLEPGVRRHSMCECQGDLYAGNANAHLFRYDGSSKWIDLGSPIQNGDTAIEAAEEFGGKVYVTGNFWFNGRVFCYKP